MADKTFPGPYLNSAKKDETVMKYVPMSTMGIGARPSGLPKNVASESMGIEHVGGTTSGKL